MKTRIALRYERVPAESIHEGTSKDTKQTEPGCNVIQAHGSMISMQYRSGYPEVVEPMHHDHPYAHDGQQGQQALGPATNQDHEWQNEVPQQQDC